jgi:hypothetical protein
VVAKDKRIRATELQAELDQYGIYLADLVGHMFNDPRKRNFEQIAADARHGTKSCDGRYKAPTRSDCSPADVGSRI